MKKNLGVSGSVDVPILAKYMVDRRLKCYKKNSQASEELPRHEFRFAVMDRIPYLSDG